MIAVIADDITGAAEMAGIARHFGLRVELVMDVPDNTDCDVLVVATDTRSMQEAEAADESRRVAESLHKLNGVTAIFKKTDSALRGHVVAELEAILAATDYKKALYLPANPSKERLIRGGVYYIGERQLHETDFSFDPEFPAVSSRLEERFPDAAAKNISFADAATGEEIELAVGQADDGMTVLAGAADLFTAFLRHTLGCSPMEEKPCVPDLSDCLIICGSTQSKPIDCGAVTMWMPRGVYDGDSDATAQWIKGLGNTFTDNKAMILAVNHHHRTGREVAVYLRGLMADVVASLVEIRSPKELIIEGGATAYSILRRLSSRSFTVTDQLAPGVVRMRAADGTHITMKPGSYPWGSLFPTA